MFAARSHARAALVVPCARRCLVGQQQQRHRSASSVKAEMLRADNEVARHLADSGVWASARSRGRKKLQADRYRVNVVSDKLCDDIINYIKPTLTRHEGCDLLDFFPGAGVWSRKLNDLLRPRSHILLEPDEDFYRPLLEPLLQRPGTKLLPESGIVWEQLNRILSPDHLPHQVERRCAPEETPQRNDTLLVTMNLAMYPKRRFRTFESLAQLVIFQIISSIRPSALFQKYGLVRILMWVSDAEKLSILPRTAQRRRKSAIEAELATEWVCEVAGTDMVDMTGPRSTTWFRRDQSIDIESTGKVLERMRRAGFRVPPGRESQELLGYLEISGEEVAAAGEQAMRIDRPYVLELERLEADFKNGVFEAGSPEHKRLKTLQYWLRWSARRGELVLELLRERDQAIRAHADAGSDPEALARAARMGDEWNQKVQRLEKSLRAECILHRDNLQVLRHDPPVLNWDRRYVEPLIVRPTEFFPNEPCALLDIQPKAAPRVLREMGPGSSRSGDMFDLVLRALVQHSVDPISKALEAIYPGAGDGVYPHCPSLTDPRLGGSPLRGWGELTPRCLSERQFVEIAEAWMKWPFRPTYAELVSRTVDDAGIEDTEEDGVTGTNYQPFE